MIEGDLIADKYRVERELGHGATGVVYRARDVRLDRAVAIRIGDGGAAAAQALARLAHPNVVAVYEVGEIGERVFVAMELVDGGTARSWRRARRRTAREVIALYGAAGLGLAAAHAAGVAHGAFTADDVLIGDDGRPRVAGFAHADGGALDDQRAWCAALSEALRELRAPRHVQAALRRGLRDDPAERWPSMEPLLAEVRRDPARRARNVAIGAAMIAAIGAAVIVPRVLAGDRADRCAGGAAQLAGIWSPARADALRRALDDPRRPWTVPIGARVTGALDAWAGRWAVQYRAVCEAGGAAWSPAMRDRGVTCLARARGELAAAIDVLAHPDADTAARADDVAAALAPPEACADPAYLGAALAPPTEPRVIAAVAAADPFVSRVDALIAAGRHVEARVLAGALVPLARSIGHPPLAARSLAALGGALVVRKEFAAAADVLPDAYFASRDAQDAGGAAMTATRVARTLQALGRGDETDAWARLASADAKVAGDPRVAIAALGARAMVEENHGQLADAMAFADRGVATARALAAPSPLAQALDRRSDILVDRGDVDRAIADLDEAMAVTRRAYGDDAYYLVQLGADLSYAQSMIGRADDAIATAKAALALSEKIFGPDHRITQLPLSDLAVAFGHADRQAEAIPIWQRIIAYDARVLGDVDDTAGDLVNYGLVLTAQGRPGEALAAYARALAILDEIHGPDVEIALTESNVAIADNRLGRFADAAAAATRALARFDAHPGHGGYAGALTARGAARLGLRDLAGARADLERALALRDGPGADPGARAYTQLYLAETYVALGLRERARPLASIAIVVLRADEDPIAARLAALARALGPAR